MTVSTTAVSVSYSGDGNTTAFPITFQFGTSADLSVVLVNDDTGAETPQSLTTHYTVSQSAGGTGTLTMLTAPASGYTLVIDRDTALAQPDSLRNQGRYYPETVESMFDRVVRQVQDYGKRALRIRGRDVGSVSTDLPTPSGLQLIGWDADAGALRNFDPETYVTTATAGVTYQYDVSAGATTLDVSNIPGPWSPQLLVYNGIFQDPSGWTLSGTTITFSEALPDDGTVSILAIFTGPGQLNDAEQVSFTPLVSGGVTRQMRKKAGDTLDARDTNAAGDGVTNDRAALGNLGLALPSGRFGAGRVTGRHRVTGADLTFTTGAQITGERIANDTTSRASWMTLGSTILLDPSYKIRMQNGSGMSGMVVMRDGMDTTAMTAADVANYAGTAIDLVSAGVRLEKLTILGFNTGIFASAAINNSRTRLTDLEIDCINGIDYGFDAGMPHITRVRCEPILTSTPPDADNERAGFGIKLHSQVDGASLTDCFVFQKYGYIFENVNSTNTKGCWADTGRLLWGGIGMQILGTSTEHQHVGFRASSHTVGVRVNVTPNGDNPRVHTFTGLHLWQCNDVGLECLSGLVKVNGGVIARMPPNYAGDPEPAGDGVAIRADGADAIVYVEGVHFGNVEVAMEAINGGVIYYSNCTFDDVTTRFVGDVRPMAAPLRTRQSAVKPLLLPATGLVSTATVAMAANQLRLYPVTIPEGYAPDTVAIEVTTGAAANVRLAVFAHDPETGGPGALIEESGELDCSTTGEKVFTLSAAITGRPLVWIGCVFNGAPTVRSMATGAGFLGAHARTSHTAGYVASYTYGAMPADASALTLGATGGLVSTALYKA